MALNNLLLERLFAYCEGLSASDIHLGAGVKPRFRVQGRLEECGEFPALDSEMVDAAAMTLGLTTLPVGSPDGAERIRMHLLERGAMDGAITSPTGARYRFNIYRENSRTAVALRRLDSGFLPLEKLGIPLRMENFCSCRDGLVLVTGPAGSGKSTTLATLIDRINRTRKGHIITIEDPVEHLHESKLSLVRQRQIGRDAASFHAALVEALRQDPDVILMGELRELATIRTAITAAETGHLVFATLHAGDAAGAVERITGVFPAEEQTGIRQQLALVLRGILAQRLLPGVAEGSRIAACELLVNTTGIANIIATGRTTQIYSAIETGAKDGMVTLEASLAELVGKGKITVRTALAAARSPENLAKRLSLQ
ncbi:MAG: PilT/PilU family type 4a pilus ATPase [Kiritimatiellae bacterium]|nr:PilT/PilU family type 4a pilus ATPase [Kiritimatiellia bacterium]